MFARGAIGGLCNDFTYGCGGRLSGTEARRLDRQDFKFHTGETMPELRLHYTTIGEPSGQPVLVLHGSGDPRRTC